MVKGIYPGIERWRRHVQHSLPHKVLEHQGLNVLLRIKGALNRLKIK
jgi:hypothetical protein